MTRAAPEAAIQRAIVDALRLALPRSAMVISIPNEGRRSVVAGARLRAQGLTAGAADMLICCGGRALFLEIKTRRGRQSTEQRDFEAASIAAGIPYLVARSVDDALAAVGLYWPLRIKLAGVSGNDRRPAMSNYSLRSAAGAVAPIEFLVGGAK